MASVAAAIEQAAGNRVADKSLWWDLSFIDLLSLFENASSFDTTDSLSQKLKENHYCLSNLMAFFKCQNSESRSAVNGNEVTIGDSAIEINSELREIALKASSYLRLDEVQTYLLVSRFIRSEKLIRPYGYESSLELVAMRYFLERQCLLKCIIQILMYNLTGGDESTGIMKETANKLLKDGLEEKIINFLGNPAPAEMQENMDIQYSNLWAQETLIEEDLMMDLLFLVYYQPQHICTPDKLNKLFNILKDILSGSSNCEKLVVTEEARSYAVSVKVKVILILIEALDLESLLYMLFNEVSFSQGSHPFSMEDLQEIENLVSDLGALQLPECSPILFMWAIYIYLISMLPDSENQFVLDINHLDYIRQAFDGGALDSIYNMLQSDAFQGLDGLITGYKSVLKTLMAGFIAAYDLYSKDERILNHVLNILCEIYTGQEGLCSEFWDRESIVDGPIRSFLFALMKNFPFKTTHLVKFLSSVCEGAWSSQCIYDFLCRGTNVTTSVHVQNISFLQERSEIVQAHVALQVPGSEALVIPAGTNGHLVKFLSTDVVLVCWKINFPGLLVMLLRLTQEILDSQIYEEVVGILQLLDRMLSFNKGTRLKLLDFKAFPIANGTQIERSLRYDVVSTFCSVINNIVESNTDSRAVGLCLSILCKLSDCCPARVFPEILRTPLFEMKESCVRRDGWLVPDGLVRYLSLEGDQGSGTHYFTICYLDLCNHFLGKGFDKELATSLVIYAVRYILVNHVNWKYKQPFQRWQISSKVFALMQTGILCKKEQHSELLQSSLLDIILHDTMVINVLLQVLCTKCESLEELYFNSGIEAREIECIKIAVESGLDLLCTVLSMVVGNMTQEQAGTSSLEERLLHQSMPNSFLDSATYLLSCSRNTALQVLAVRTLSYLCVVAQRIRPHPVSFESLLVSSQQRSSINSVICSMLSEETATSNAELFSAVMNFLKSAALYQTTFLDTLLLEQGKSELIRTSDENQSNGQLPITKRDGNSTVEVAEGANIINVVSTYVKKCETLMESNPLLLSEILGFLAAVWKGGYESICTLDSLVCSDNFWRSLRHCLSMLSTSEVSSNSINDEGVTFKAHQYQCKSFVLDIMAQDLFFKIQVARSEMIGKSDLASLKNTFTKTNGDTNAGNKKVLLKYTIGSCADKILSGLSRNKEIHMLNKHFTQCLYDYDFFSQAKKVQRSFVVGLICRVLNDDYMGLSLTLLEHVQSLSRCIFEHPAFLELSEQYRRGGYSYGQELQSLIVNDLYYHLQGEFEGRKIPPGPFQQLSDHVTNLKLDSFLQICKVMHGKDLQPANHGKYIYDSKSLENEIGLEWLLFSGNKGFTAIAEKMLKTLNCINRASFLADSQLVTSKQWMAMLVLSLSIDRSVEGRDPSDSSFSEESIYLCIEDLCTCQMDVTQMLEMLKDPPKYISTFLTVQAKILFAFINWLYRRRSLTDKAKCWPLCARVIRTVTVALKRMTIFKPHGFETLVTSLLAVLLTALELIHFQNKEKHHDGQSSINNQDVGDAFADICLVCLGFLPFLCSFMENKSFLHLSLSILDSLLRGFLAESTWLSVLQKHIPIHILVRHLQSESKKDVAYVILNVCLSLARSRGGTELLYNAGLFSCLSIFSCALREEASTNIGNSPGPFSYWNTSALSNGLWGLAIAIVTAMLNTAGKVDVNTAILDSVMAFFLSEIDYILAALHSPILRYGSSRERAKPQKIQCSLMALKDTEQCVTLMCQLAKHEVSWLNVMHNVDSKRREPILHLLSFIAKEGIESGNIGKGSVVLHCPPLQKEEMIANEKPSALNCKSGWFSVLASSQISKSRKTTLSQRSVTANPIVPYDKESTEGSASVNSSEYTDLLAVQVYRIALLLLHLYCIQAQMATKRIDEVGDIDLVHFPELPGPEILHKLQDQAIAILLEVCTGKNEAVGDTSFNICTILLKIIEKSLFLEACATRICGSTPVADHIDVFSKQYNALLSAVHHKQDLEGPVLCLKRVVALVYPGL